VPAWDFTSAAHNLINNSSGYDFGNNFSTNNPVTAVALGYFVPIGGLTISHDVALYDSVGNLLASVTAADPIIGHFAYAAITPVLLNGTYQVDGVSGLEPFTYNDPGFATNAAINYLGNTYISGGTTPAFINFAINDVTDGYWGPDVLLSPLPSTWAMLIGGFVGLGFLVYRGTKKHAALAAA
jgi:hypothetical protein